MVKKKKTAAAAPEKKPAAAKAPLKKSAAPANAPAKQSGERAAKSLAEFARQMGAPSYARACDNGDLQSEEDMGSSAGSAEVKKVVSNAKKTFGEAAKAKYVKGAAQYGHLAKFPIFNGTKAVAASPTYDKAALTKLAHADKRFADNVFFKP
jgi:hypothetical protein